MSEIIRPTKETLEKLKKIPVSSALGHLRPIGNSCYMDRKIRPLQPDTVFAGPALTVRWVAYREDVKESYSYDKMYDVADMIKPNDVVVIDAMGLMRGEVGIWGDCIMTGLVSKGASGIVVDGLIRDGATIRRFGYPVFCRGVSPILPRGTIIPAEINTPINCGGVYVRPGDVILADYDGVLVIPREMADKVAEEASKREDFEETVLFMLRHGEPLRGSYPPDINSERYKKYEAMRKPQQT